MEAQKKAPAEASAIQNQGNSLNTTFCSGFGQYHSAKNKRDPKPYVSVTLDQIEDMAAAPQSVAKDSAQWAIFSNLASRDVVEQRKNGEFYALWADIDEPQGRTLKETFSLAQGVMPFDMLGYTSRSATEEKQKGRFVIPLAHPVSGRDFEILQKILNDKLESAGITPDRKTETANQICYLPNKGEFYDYELDPFSGSLSVDDWGEEYHAEQQALEAVERQRNERMEQSLKRARERLQTDLKSPIDAWKAEYRAVDQLEKYGGKVKGDRACSPLSESGNYQMQVKDDGKLLSHHGSDMEAGLGKLTESGKARIIDAFDLFTYFENGNDQNAALKAAGELFTSENGQSITKHNQCQYMAQQAQELAAVEWDFTGENKTDELALPDVKDVDVTEPPGLAGDICRLMKQKARRNRPELYPLAALHVMALAGIGRRSEYVEKLNLLTLAIAPTAAGKEAAQNVAKGLARGIGCSRLLHGDSGSFKDMIYNLVEGDGASLYLVDEIHSFLGAMKNPNAATYETKMEREILVMSETNLYTFRGMEKRQLLQGFKKDIDDLETKLDKLPEDDTQERDKLQRALEKAKLRYDYIVNGWPDPFLSLMGHSVPERLDSFLTSGNVDNGFLGRTIVVRCPETRSKLDRSKRNVVGDASLQQHIEYQLGAIQGQRQVISVTPEAEDFLDACVDWYDEDEQRNHAVVGGIYARAPEQLFKVASILGLDGGSITLEHARYAHALVQQSIEDIRFLLHKAYAESGSATELDVIAHATQTILRNCKGAGITHSRLKQMVRKPRAWQELEKKDPKRKRFDELVDSMLQDGTITLDKQGQKRRYKTA